MTSEYSVETIGLCKTFGSFKALTDLNMKVKKKEFMGLLGPNGAGKSTTLKLLTGMLRPTSGEAYINGYDIRDHKNAMADVGCVVETPNYYDGFTPAETLSYIGRLRGMTDEDIRLRAREVLEELKIWDWRHQKISKFSKGMKQRVGIAQALLPDPSLLILDEPTSGLDPRGMIEMRQTLADLKKFDVSLLISTHILKEVSEICESVTMIRNGTCVMAGNVLELTRGAADAGSKIMIHTIKPMSAQFISDLGALEGVRGTTPMGEDSVKVDFNGTPEQQACIVDLIQRYDLRMLTMLERSGGDLENLYMEMTKEGGSIR